MSARGKAGLPLVAFRLKGEYNFNEFDIARELRQRQWVVPAYTMAPKATDLRMLRIVLREDFTRSRCILFLRDLDASVKHLESLDKKQIEGIRKGHQSRANKSHGKHVTNPASHDKHGAEDGHSLQGKFGKSHNVC